MKKMFRILVPICIIISSNVIGQTEDQKAVTAIRYYDSLFWVAYNKCDLPGMQKFISDDIEFYHDKGGPTMGVENLMASIKRGLCGNDSFHLRRAAVDGTVRIFPLTRDGKTVYGAIISGQHNFYVTQVPKPESLEGLARFTHTWILKDGVWKMTRILSYDHGPAGRKMD